MSIETAFSRFSVYYKNSIANVGKLDHYDLICLPEEDYYKYHELLEVSEKPYIVIGHKIVRGSAGLLKRPILMKEWLETIGKLIEPVKTPVLEKIEIGVVVKSKTTPIFGKGIIVSLIGEDEMMVRFPKNPLLPKEKAIRCHKSQLQIIGKIDDYLN